uniref:Nickel/cobalt efflux system n=1 Tax=Helicotheca tamesis TaxID=374047 RepID=A0A7S2H891_9STRA|mmetsp:Transcript_16015/g.21976  ORF Transcript_16015/g.21976 Transcript_16015/m.21976 type:complete len:319 (+) Transcript_16015:74-1030(+)
MPASPPITIIGSGIVMGIVHVLTGPDHLSALATLSANVGNFKAFGLGVRWGIGHSTGLVVVAAILIAFSGGGEVDMPDYLSTAFESLVGVFMICIGIFGFVKACRKEQSTSSTEEKTPMKTGENYSTLQVESGEASMSLADVAREGEVGESRTKIATLEISNEEDETAFENEQPLPVLGDDTEMSPSKWEYCFLMPPCCRCCYRCPNEQDNPLSTAGLLALGIGIVHGIAGPGGVLGVIPAVQLHNTVLASLYIGTFCVTSTIVMGTFAALYGTFSERLASTANMGFYMECFSSSLSIVVGVTWLVLLYLGILDEVFP